MSSWLIRKTFNGSFYQGNHKWGPMRSAKLYTDAEKLETALGDGQTWREYTQRRLKGDPQVNNRNFRDVEFYMSIDYENVDTGKKELYGIFLCTTHKQMVAFIKEAIQFYPVDWKTTYASGQVKTIYPVLAINEGQGKVWTFTHNAHRIYVRGMSHEEARDGRRCSVLV